MRRVFRKGSQDVIVKHERREKVRKRESERERESEKETRARS